MSFQDKLEAAQKELSETKICISNHTPPVLVLLRKFGFKIKPFHYSSFISNFIATSLWFGAVSALIIWFITWQSSGMPIKTALLTCVFASLSFGLLMALYYKNSAKKNNLSDWCAL